MKKISKKVVFFGNERLATGVKTRATTLNSLIQHGYDVAAVVINQDPYKSRVMKELEVEDTAIKNGLKILKPTNLSEVKESLRDLGAEVGVLVAYGKIIPNSIINIFSKGIINIHPSLLPKGRGPTPIEQVILEGDSETGVSIMQLVKDMDAGPVFTQSRLKLSGIETKQELADSLLELGGKLIIECLPDILSGKMTSSPQDNDLASYNRLITKQDGVINWQLPAEEISRQLRAYLYWPKCRTQLGNQEVIIVEARVIDNRNAKPGEIIIEGSQLLVGCGEGLLIVDTIQPVNKPEMPIKAFLAGYKQSLGTEDSRN